MKRQPVLLPEMKPGVLVPAKLAMKKLALNRAALRILAMTKLVMTKSRSNGLRTVKGRSRLEMVR